MKLKYWKIARLEYRNKDEVFQGCTGCTRDLGRLIIFLAREV